MESVEKRLQALESQAVHTILMDEAQRSMFKDVVKVETVVSGLKYDMNCKLAAMPICRDTS